MEVNAQYVIDEMAKTIMQLQLEKSVQAAQIRQMMEAVESKEESNEES